MIFIQLYLGLTLAVWIRRAILMLGSIKKYSIMPILKWQKGWGEERVSVIVPCRNEARNIPILLPSLLAQDYPNLEFIFIDDRSTDETHSLLQEYAKKDKRIQVIRGKSLPQGWTGKNHAMHQAVQVSTGSWLFFTDADTEHDAHSVTSSIHYAEQRKVDLLTLSARCVCKSLGEHLIQPMGIGCFAVWFKLEDVNDPNSSVPLACGQYLVIKRNVFDVVGGSERIKDAVVEDLALFKNVKSTGYKCELAIGSHIFATRMYQSLKEAWVGWRRIYLHALEKNVSSILHKVFMLLVFSFAPFLVLALGLYSQITGVGDWHQTLPLSSGLVLFILFLRSRSHTALKAPQWSIILHPFSALIIAGIILDCLRHHFLGKKVEWKAQHY